MPVDITISQFFPFDFMFEKLCEIVLLGVDRRLITHIRPVRFIKCCQRIRTGYAITRHLNADIVCSYIGYRHKYDRISVVLFRHILHFENMIFVVVIANPDTFPSITVGRPILIVLLCILDNITQHFLRK